MKELIIYILGFIICYAYFKYSMEKKRKERTWGDVSLRLLGACFSIIMIFVLIMVGIFDLLEKLFLYIAKNLPKTPPKWL